MVRGSGTGSWSLRPRRSRSVLRGESTTTYASSKLNRVGRRAARYDSGLSAHKYNRPAHKRLTPHRIAHGQIACSRSRCGNLSTLHLAPVNSHSQTLSRQPTHQHNHARYDGNGLRVQKVSGGGITTVYIFSGSKVIAEYDNGTPVAAPSREYIYSGAALVAKTDSTGTKYYHQDRLSNRLVTDSSGNTFTQMGHFPYGEPWYNATNDKLLFTTYERDSDSSNDYAMARYHINRFGRFSSPDPLDGSIDNPQSLNLYAYVVSDPVNLDDASGMGPCGTGDDLCVVQDAFNSMPPIGFSSNWELIQWLTQRALTPTGWVPGNCPEKNGDCPLVPVYGNASLLELVKWLSASRCGVPPFLPCGNGGNLLGGSNAKIGPGPADTKMKYCSHQSDLAAVEDLLPGITRGNYVSTVSKISAETGAHLALEGAAASSVFKRAIRTRIGVPMSTTSKILGRVTVALFLYSGYEALKAAQDEYQACMNY